MANLLETATTWLAGQMKTHAARTVTYRRGAGQAVLKAGLGKKLLRVSDELGGSRTIATERDYLVAAADLVLAGLPILPERGDKITDAGDPDGVSRVYEVLSPGGDEEPWQWMDPARTLLRIHTKLVRQG